MLGGESLNTIYSGNAVIERRKKRRRAFALETVDNEGGRGSS